MTDAPTLEEKYARAIKTSHLEVTEFAGDVDVVIAAGWAGSRLGALFLRLRAEFDAVRASARPMNTTERLLVLSQLKSLPEARGAMGRMALGRACVRHPDMPADIVRKLVGRALDIWLDPNCGHCDGRGYNGGYGVPRIGCKHCRETGRRHRWIGKTDEEQAFAEGLLTEIDRATTSAARSMSARLRR